LLRSAIVKIASRSKGRREMAIKNRGYLKELNFFRELVSKVPLRPPTVHHARSDGSADAAVVASLRRRLSPEREMESSP